VIKLIGYLEAWRILGHKRVYINDESIEAEKILFGIGVVLLLLSVLLIYFFGLIGVFLYFLAVLHLYVGFIPSRFSQL
jgi:hypothetical protein